MIINISWEIKLKCTTQQFTPRWEKPIVEIFLICHILMLFALVVVMVMVQTSYNIVPFFGCEKIRKGRKIDPSYYAQELNFPNRLSYNHEQKTMWSRLLPDSERNADNIVHISYKHLIISIIVGYTIYQPKIDHYYHQCLPSLYSSRTSM